MRWNGFRRVNRGLYSSQSTVYEAIEECCRKHRCNFLVFCRKLYRINCDNGFVRLSDIGATDVDLDPSLPTPFSNL